MKTDSELPKQDAVDLPEEQPTYELDIDTLPKQQHRWVDRGLKMSCEGAGHPMHQAWKLNTKK